MIQVTCGACGAVQELADADVPPGGKSITCASCKSRIAVPGSKPTAASAALPDLPAPRRPSPLAGAGPAKPTPKSALSSVEDLPAPRKPALPDLAPPPSPSASSRMSDTTDLPAPKRQIPAIPPPMVSSASVPDLVAPKRAPTPPVIPSRPPPAIPAIGARSTVSGIAPGPKPTAPTGPGEIDLDDLLAPAPRSGMSDLPAPRRAVGEPDLPAPKRPSEITDLPQPKRPSEIADLPQPASAAAQARHQAGSTDLPAPKGFFDDLPQPARNQGGSTDLPAPKGFFDDLPQPARQQNATGLPAPKGFFDDIPQVAKHQSGPLTPVMPAAPAAAKPPTATAKPAGKPTAPDGGRLHSPSAPPPTADDLFNDLTPPPVLTTPPALDLDDLDLGPPGDAAAGAPRAKSPSTSGARGSQPGPSKSQTIPPPSGTRSTIPPPSGTRSTEDSDVDGQALPMLDLGDGPADRSDFGGVDLPRATPVAPAQGPTGVSFKSSRPGGNHEPMALSANAADLTLDVEETKKAPERRKRRTSLKQGKAAAAPTSKRRTGVILLVVLLLAGLGAGGFYMWRRHQKAQAAAADLKDKLQGARAAMVAGDAQHWSRAQLLANQVFTANPTNAEAAGIAASAAFASVFDDGQAADQRAKAGAATINLALGKALSGPDLDKAQGLKLVNDGQAARGLEKYLEPAAKRAPADANAALFLGWGRLAAGDHAGAIEAFDRSAKGMPKRDLPAVLGRARAKLAMGDLAGARADFTLVLERDKVHVGAQVGLAASATTPAEISQREKDLAALLRTKDIDKADPRALAQAYTLLGDDARRGNRFDSARDHYRKAAVKAPLETAPLRGLAQLELVEGKLDAAAETIEKGLKIAPNSIDLHLVAGEIEVRRGKLADAEARIAKIKELKPASASDKSRLFLLTGRWHETNNRLDDALAAYEDAIATADPNDVAPPLAAATLLGKMAAAADPIKAAELRARATKLLEPMETKAGSDPAIAIALGIGYLAAGEIAKAETWLRHAIAAKPDDIDAHFQLAEALSAQGKRDDALAILRKAFELDPTRLDVGLQLARRYEDAGRIDDASAMYDTLLAGKDITLDLRARAGRFYERTDKIDKAREQGDEILKVDPKHPAGLFLKGVGLLAEGKLEPARRALQEATDADKDAQYLDALGRANEALGRAGDPRGKDDAMRAYTAASLADPTMLNPLAGMGRLLVERREGDKALEPLLAATKLSPRDPDIQYNIGLAYQLIQKGPEAIGWMTKSLATKPRADGFYNVGNMYYEAENFRMAAPALTRATELGGALERSSGTTIDWMVEAYFRLGSAEKDLHHGPAARKAWQAFIDRNPKDQVKVEKIKIEMLGLPR